MMAQTGSAIVTGAGSGIGRAIALRLATDGYAVLVNDLSGDRAQAVTAEIITGGGAATAIAGDVARPEDVTTIHAAAETSHGDVTLLINNAGIAHQAAFEDLELADFDRMFAVHVRGTFLMTKAVMPSMLARGKGVIVNVASQLGQIGGIELVHYSGADQYAAGAGAFRGMARTQEARATARSLR